MTDLPGQRPLVTIWETYGSGAATVGRAIASALSVRFVEQALSSEELEAAEETADRGEGLLTRVLNILGRTAPAADAGIFSGAVLAHDVEGDVRRLREWVRDGGVVVGRNATVLLADVPAALHVKLDGPLDRRIARGAAEAGIDLARARARQAREDRVRSEISLRLFDWDPRTDDRFDLVLNTGLLSTETVVDIVSATLQIRGAALR